MVHKVMLDLVVVLVVVAVKAVDADWTHLVAGHVKKEVEVQMKVLMMHAVAEGKVMRTAQTFHLECCGFRSTKSHLVQSYQDRNWVGWEEVHAWHCRTDQDLGQGILVPLKIECSNYRGTLSMAGATDVANVDFLEQQLGDGSKGHLMQHVDVHNQVQVRTHNRRGNFDGCS